MVMENKIRCAVTETKTIFGQVIVEPYNQSDKFILKYYINISFFNAVVKGFKDGERTF